MAAVRFSILHRLSAAHLAALVTAAGGGCAWLSARQPSVERGRRKRRSANARQGARKLRARLAIDESYEPKWLRVMMVMMMAMIPRFV